MYCKHCGREFPEGSLYCPYCGMDLSAPNIGSELTKKKKPKSALWIGAVAVVAALALLFGGRGGKDEVPGNTVTAGEAVGADTPAPKPMKTPSPTPTPEPVDLAMECYEQAEDYYNKGNYYKAFDTLMSYDGDNEGEAADKFEDLMAEIERQAKQMEPVSGKEFTRTFTYQGGGELQVTAESGPVVVMIKDIDNKSQYVDFYVRKGETGTINLPGGNYSIAYKLGILWFGDDIGFGEYCYEDKFDEILKFDVSVNNAWITNSVWMVTI